MDRDIEEPAPGVLKNDKDVDGDSFTAELVKGPSCNGVSSSFCARDFKLNPDGSFTYKSRDDVYTDSFTYKANDVDGDSNVATVNITVKDTDRDGDGVPDSSDNCQDVSNPNQADANNNGIGDACEQAVQSWSVAETSPLAAAGPRDRSMRAPRRT
jgi:hypothetical protein